MFEWRIAAKADLGDIDPEMDPEMDPLRSSFNRAWLIQATAAAMPSQNGPTVRTAVAVGGNFVLVLAWQGMGLDCGVDVKPITLASLVDPRLVLSRREWCYVLELSQPLGDWALVAWALKAAAHRSSTSNSHFNPFQFHVDWSRTMDLGSGETLVYPMESAWSGKPIRCAWIRRHEHIFAFAYNACDQRVVEAIFEPGS